MIRPYYFAGHSPVYNHPFIIEQWMEITPTVVEHILPGYYISTFGRVYSTRSNKFLSINQSIRGYNQVLLFGSHGKTICARIDRLIMKSFYPIDNMDYMQVNHRNADNSYDVVTNLEWTTPQENTQYAIMNGDCKYKRDRSLCKILTNEEADQIGQLLQSRSISQIKIAHQFGVSIDVIESISSGKTTKYRWVYDKYKLADVKGTKPHSGIYPREQIAQICQFFQDNLKDISNYKTKKEFYQQALYSIGDMTPIDYNKIAFLDRLRARKIYPDIISNYDF